MSNNRSENNHLFNCVVLLLGVFAIARSAGWIGPKATVRLDDSIMWPAIAVISLWGLARLYKNWSKA